MTIFLKTQIETDGLPSHVFLTWPFTVTKSLTPSVRAGFASDGRLIIRLSERN